jgi:hypothetical protein
LIDRYEVHVHSNDLLFLRLLQLDGLFPTFSQQAQEKEPKMTDLIHPSSCL